MRDNHRFTNAKKGQPQSWYSFSSGLSGLIYSASFAKDNRLRAELYIDTGKIDLNKSIFDKLLLEKKRLKKRLVRSYLGNVWTINVLQGLPFIAKAKYLMMLKNWNYIKIGLSLICDYSKMY